MTGQVQTQGIFLALEPLLERQVPGPQVMAVDIGLGIGKYAAEQAISEEEALKKGMEEKSKEFVEKGAEVYAKA